MRGLLSVHACISPNCYNINSGDGIIIGDITINDSKNKCKCGGIKFELLVDRRCNGIFLKGYRYKDSSSKIIWNNTDIINETEYEILHLFVVPKNLSMEYIKQVCRKQKCEVGHINSKTGEFYELGQKFSTENTLHVLVKTAIRKEGQEISFSVCPACGKTHLHLTTLSTKGNEPFANVVLEQLTQQAEKSKI